MYWEGIGVAVDLEKAFFWFKKSADNGDNGAMNNVGVMSLEGQGTPINLEQAYDYFYAAARSGLNRGMLNVARMYRNGSGVLKDGEKAKFWYEKASQTGFQLADLEMADAEALIKQEREMFDKLKVSDWEIKMKLEREDLSISQRIQRFLKGLDSNGNNNKIFCFVVVFFFFLFSLCFSA